ncbi:hypothetical protein [Pseudoduganella rhizocola]|uniref:hypothetical protein n=1 Tax=Pseudoduganella rhizocola TaxID=3382643 RepID=UPI0038B68349
MMPMLAAAVGLLAALHYLRRGQWPDAGLVLLAGFALAALLLHERVPPRAITATLDTEDPTALRAGLANAAQAERLRVRGDGLREAMWNDLPALPMEWQPAPQDKLWLDFPRSIAQGRVFALTIRRPSAPEPWSAQLLAENGQVLAEAKADGRGNMLSLTWLPPVAESMVLTARLRNAAGKTIAEGPVPLLVQAPMPLRLQGRFASPSFDARALNQLLTDSGAVLDWRTQLGKSVARSETPSEVLSAPHGIVIDAAYAEGLAPQALAALLAQVGEGTPMLVLGGSASQAGFWQRAMDLRLAPAQGDDPQRQAAKLQLAAAPLLPVAKGSGWRAMAVDAEGEPWLSQRSWRKGRISWLSVSGWHRYAISEPLALAQWWQTVFDQSLGESAAGKTWRFPDPMPLPGLRTEICADGLAAGQLVAGGAAKVELLPRADRSGAACAAVWPERAGWLTVGANGMAATQLYVFANGDWPAWQRALRHDATTRYAARSRTPARASVESRTGTAGPAQAAALLPGWCWAALFAAAMLALWWRERR